MKQLLTVALWTAGAYCRTYCYYSFLSQQWIPLAAKSKRKRLQDISFWTLFIYTCPCIDSFHLPRNVVQFHKHDLWLLSRSSLFISFDPFLKEQNIRYFWKRGKLTPNNLLICCENYSALSLVLFLAMAKAFNYLLYMSIKYVLQMSYTIQDAHKMLYVHRVLFHCIKVYTIVPWAVLDDGDIL